MSSRRRNLFVILLMLGFMVGSVAIIVTKETKLGLDLKGGVELVYQGEPTPQSEVTPEAIDRAIEIMRERVDRLGVAEPEIQRLGNDQISVGLPGVKNLERAKAQVGTTAQLYLYDWERNVVGSPTAPINSLYSAVKRASQRPPQIDDNNTTKEQFYLFRPNKTLAAGPDSSRKELLSEYDGRVPKGFEVLQVPPGTVVLKAERPENLAERRAVRALLRRAGQPRAARHRHQGPAPGKRPDDGRADRHLPLHRPGPQELPGGHPPPGRARADPPGAGTAGGELLPDLRDRPRPRARVAAVHRLPREPGRDRRAHRGADLGRLQAPGGAGPRRRPEDRRAADRPEAHQRDPGLRLAREAGAARGPPGRRGRLRRWCCSS